jgi:hypothetical protein
MKTQLGILSIIAVSSCTTLSVAPPSSPQNPITAAPINGIEIAADDRCFAEDAPQTQTRIVEETQVIVPELRDLRGRVTRPAVVRSVDQPKTFVIGPGQRFETLCPQAYTPEFVASLQRALSVRNAYAGPISGNYDEMTRNAVAAFQRADGIDSPLLGIDAARLLGLIAVARAS